MTDTATSGELEVSSSLKVENVDQTPNVETKPTSNESSTITQPLQDVTEQANSSETSSIPKHIPINGTNITGNQPTATPQLSIEQQLVKAKRDVESMVLKYAKSEQENLKNKIKVEELDKKLKRAVKDNDQLANRIKLLTNDKSQLRDTLNAKVAQLTVLEQKNTILNQSQVVKLKDCEEKIKKLEVNNEDLLKQIETYKSKEGELLDFSERLSMKHLMLQTELDEALKKVPSYKEQYEQVLEERDGLKRKCEDLSGRIEGLTISLKEKTDCFERERVEWKAVESKYKSTIDELQNEIKVMRRRHQIATKEMAKEMKQLQKLRLEKAAKVAEDLNEGKSLET